MTEFQDQVQGVIGGAAPWTILFEHYGKNCPKCGKPLLRPRKRDRDGNHMGGACATPRCGYKEQLPNAPTKTQKQRQAERKARYNDLIKYFKKYSIFNSFSMFVNKTFKNYKPVDSQSAKAKQLAMKLAKDIADDRVVHGGFFGSVGTGKTHLSAAIFEKAEELTQWNLKVQFIDIAMAVALEKLSFNDEGAKKHINDVKSQLGKSDLVIVDDLGAEMNTDFSKSFADELMRIREDKSIIVTSNLSGDDNGFSRYTGQTTSRMGKHMRGNSITLINTPDYRKRADDKEAF